MNVQYQGFFINSEVTTQLRKVASTLGNSLSKPTEKLHITFTFKPKGEILNSFNAFVGQQHEVHVVGYANDGMNEGLLVTFPDGFPAELKSVYEVKGAKHPHFTLSINSEEGAKAKDTVSLFDREDVVYFETPISITGALGYCGWDQSVSFEKLS